MADSQENLDGDKQEAPKPPVTMKVDAPAEDSCKQDNEANERRDQEDLKTCSPSTRPNINSTPVNPFSLSSPFMRNTILKPPQLSLNNTNNTTTAPAKPSFVLNPSRLTPLVRKIGEENCIDSEKKSLINGETPKFVPLKESDPKSASVNQINSTSPSSSPSPASASGPTTAPGAVPSAAALNQNSSFVFGQNLRDRVIVAPLENNKTNNDNNEPVPSTSLNSNGTSEMLFSSALKNEVKIDTATSSTNVSKDTTKSLSESAREYEESRANKRKYEEVEVKTGEEGETNILNVSCKLFAFDKTTSNWQERGRGTLRLNDLEDSDGVVHCSRLVFRTAGSLRVVLNTKIWAEMTIEKASEKSVRFTALDANGEIKVFLAMASMDDSKHLLQEIQKRVQKEITLQKHKKLHTNSSSDSGGN